ncbi:MAG: FIST C-terminal domain-containing protein [Phormidesmis sp.]
MTNTQMFKAAVGHSDDPDATAASREILAQCRDQLGGECPQAGLLFAAPDFEHGLILQAITRQFPGIALIGGTSDGEISSALKFQQDSVTLIVFCSDEVEFCAAVGRDLSQYMRTSNGSYDATTGSITFFADIPEQSEIQIVRSTRDEIVDSARASAAAALKNYSGETPAAALFFSCTGRLQRLGTRTPEEYQSIQTVLSPDIPSCGFYTNGEIAPIYAQGESQFHNETFVTLLLGTR